MQKSSRKINRWLIDQQKIFQRFYRLEGKRRKNLSQILELDYLLLLKLYDIMTEKLELTISW
jgi:hypothetical protein